MERILNGVQVKEVELKCKRELLLEKNQKLDAISSTANRLDPEESKDKNVEEDPLSELVDDIMLLNEEVESQDSHVTTLRRHLHSLADVLQQAHREELGERDEHQASAELALQLVKTYSQVKTLETKLLQQLESIGEQMSRDPLSTPLPYMLQLPPTQVRIHGRNHESMQLLVHSLVHSLSRKKATHLHTCSAAMLAKCMQSQYTVESAWTRDAVVTNNCLIKS